MAKTSDEAKQAFRQLVPAGTAITVRPMFGSLAAFVNGNMFAGVFGDELFVRATDSQREQLLEEGARDFMPMPGRAMKGYVSLPDTWRTRPESATLALARALQLTSEMPAKVSTRSAKKKAKT